VNKQHEENDELDGSELNRGQGKALALREILRVVDTAESELVRIQDRIQNAEARRKSTT
jgi:hypothetical protein